MIACDIINGVLCLGLLGASIPGLVPAGVALALIYTITFVMEICNLLFVPAKNALIPMIVEERDLAAANGLSYTTQQASMLIGLLASGAFIAGVRGAAEADHRGAGAVLLGIRGELPRPRRPAGRHRARLLLVRVLGRS